MYVLISGLVDVIYLEDIGESGMQEHVIAQLSPGDLFGETALMGVQIRGATVRTASSYVTCSSIHSDIFDTTAAKTNVRRTMKILAAKRQQDREQMERERLDHKHLILSRHDLEIRDAIFSGNHHSIRVAVIRGTEQSYVVKDMSKALLVQNNAARRYVMGSEFTQELLINHSQLSPCFAICPLSGSSLASAAHCFLPRVVHCFLALVESTRDAASCPRSASMLFHLAMWPLLSLFAP